MSVLNLLRGRAKADDVIAHLETLKIELDGMNESENVDTVIRSIVVQSLLSIGSRSFSHLLNAIERYLPLLRSVAGAQTTVSARGSGNAEAKADILAAAAAIWKQNRQMVVIVFDKLMQYQIVDPADVVTWTFTNVGSKGSDSGPLSLGAFEWDLLSAALDKANGRVVIARKKVSALTKEQDDTIARQKATDGTSMDVDDGIKEAETETSAAAGQPRPKLKFTILTARSSQYPSLLKMLH